MPRGAQRRPLEERFWKHINKDGPEHPELGTCWLWKGPVAKAMGLGRWKVDDAMVLAHRSAFEIQRGPIPEGDDVYQLCLNKLCMRGDHLASGPKNSGPRAPRPTEPPKKGRYASAKWKDIPGFPGYEASTEGEIRSWWARGHSVYADKPKPLKPTPNVKNGYLQVVLINATGERKNPTVHSLVLLAFKGPPGPGEEGRHFPDNDKANNRLSNLSYSTHQLNMDDRHTHGTVPRGDTHYAKLKPELVMRGDAHWMKKNPERIVRGSAHPNSKLTPELYDWVMELLDAGCTQKEVAAEVGISQERVSAIKTGKRPR